jgi:hypothetical protein
VSEKVNKGSVKNSFKAFTTIAYAIPEAKTKEEVQILFQVLCGKQPLSSAISILTNSLLLKEYMPHHNIENWKACSSWCEWWTRPNHLSKFVVSLLIISG